MGHSGEFVGPIRERSIISELDTARVARADDVREPKPPNLGHRLRGSHSVTGVFFLLQWAPVVGLMIGGGKWKLEIKRDNNGVGI